LPKILHFPLAVGVEKSLDIANGTYYWRVLLCRRLSAQPREGKNASYKDYPSGKLEDRGFHCNFPFTLAAEFDADTGLALCGVLHLYRRELHFRTAGSSSL
jgi:hypothetical protein